jgi:hypothetical protein
MTEIEDQPVALRHGPEVKRVARDDREQVIGSLPGFCKPPPDGPKTFQRNSLHT